ncbi:MAG: acyl carrier protein [Planctomycetota bacterium]|jgi:acyl carrier protein
MTSKEFIEIFKASFDELSTDIEAETIYKEIEEWTSMQALFFIAHLDDETGVVLSAEDLIETNSIEDLFDRIVTLLI